MSVNLWSTKSQVRTESPEREDEAILRRKGRRSWKLTAENPRRESKGVVRAKSRKYWE